MFRRYMPVLLSVCGGLVLFAGVAKATAPAPGWEVQGRSAPTVLRPGGEGVIYLYVYNVGAAGSTGVATLTDTLPAGLVAKASPGVELNGNAQICPGSTRIVTCTIGATGPSSALPLTLAIPVTVEADASGDPAPADQVRIVGGGALGATSSTVPVRFGSGEAGLGFAALNMWFTNADGTADTQAGSHPYQLTVVLAANIKGLGINEGERPSGGEASAVDVNLPPGLVGNPDAVPQCTHSELVDEECPAGSWIGEDLADIAGGSAYVLFQVFNMVPPPGVPAEFAFNFNGVFTALDAHLRSGGDTGITEHVNIPQRSVVFNSLTIWGFPAEHNESGLPRVPLLTLPTSCGDPAKFSLETLSTWQDPHATAPTVGFEYHTNDGVPAGFTGCERLTRFEPQLSLAPDTSFSDSTTGLEARVRIPQEVNPEGLATSGLKETTVTLPEGVSVNPGQANGLAACTLAQAGVGSNATVDDGPPGCPAASEIGTDEIETPVLKERLRGKVYLLQSNPPDLQILVAGSSERANVKVVSNVHLDPATGRLTASFDGTPQFPGLPDSPVSEFVLHFNGGPQAALVTPATCGTYVTDALFAPWAGPFISSFPLQASFQVTSGPGGSGVAACTGPLPFGPSVTAGSTTELAGGFTGLSLLLQRGDGQQRVGGLQVKAPEGLLGIIRNVSLCGEPQARQGTCSAASQIGHTVVAGGPGGYPLYLPQPGQPQAPVYLTGPYGGAPYGLSVVVPIVAGPFDLGVEVVRARIEVDPHTAQLIVTTDPFPTIVRGVPVDLRTVSAVIDRPGLLFNPTSCEPRAFTGFVTSTEGAVAPFSSRFQVGGCAALGFKPSFKVSTQARTSLKLGASLDVRVGYPQGAQANLHGVAVSLPKQLPSRLSTIQQACPGAVFDRNPASCPAGSDIGTATVRTPVLANPVTGPVYLVSRGGAAFPDLVMILQGEGVTLEVLGSIDIKHGVTSSAFGSIPDAPISSFELTLPEGPHSALGTNIPAKAGRSLCAQKLVMPTTLTGQDGAVIRQSTKITVTGCPKAKQKAKAHRRKHRKPRGRRG